MFPRGRGRKSGDIACIFVHAGAGYHSLTNEIIHLQACNDAAKSAMAVLRNGGSAVDAVEIAVKVLEDREITNSGYGSNLSIDGTVECDALVVDHLGRSGAAGAVAQIKNPVSLARLLLDRTTQTLSLRRVPPNLLVGQGATNFAYEHGMSVLPFDYLISPAAKERWKRWRNDLNRVEHEKNRDELDYLPLLHAPIDVGFMDPSSEQDETEASRRVHTKAMFASIWNEAQPVSPPPSDNREAGSFSSSLYTPSSPSHSTPKFEETTLDPDNHVYIDPLGPQEIRNITGYSHAKTTPLATPPTSFTRYAGTSAVNGGEQDQLGETRTNHLNDLGVSDRAEGPAYRAEFPMQLVCDGSTNSISEPDDQGSPLELSWPESSSMPASSSSQTESFNARPHLSGQGQSPSHPQISLEARRKQGRLPTTAREDHITDTVGAIAIDVHGNIACGASSGGIGMKHRGRIGPAALVGIGAAVIPIDPDDEDQMTVATVTSGTGEHIATTMAAGTCADRVFNNHRKIAGAQFEECEDDEAIVSFIDKDFMNHPSVKHSHSAGAIGILTVKKTKAGAYLYFGHNTDSFALASMHSDDTKPLCTMSRNRSGGGIAQGGRVIRYRRKK